MNKFKQTINKFKNINIEQLISNIFDTYQKDTKYILDNQKLYIIFGLDTTTIYSITLNDENVTVLLLESTGGDIDKLNLLLAHEYTHFIRKRLLNKEIFEDCIGERFIIEGIASNYSREMVPNMKDEDYCIVPDSTINWVKNNKKVIENLINGELSNKNLMENFFYMYADTKVEGMPVRCGYVYGYLKVKEYLEKKQLKIKDIIGLQWTDFFNNIN